MISSLPQHLKTPTGRLIAYHHSPGKTPGVIFLGGFMSDMSGTKAVALETWCKAQEIAFTRFDYSGHGASSGRFEDGSIGDWLEDALAILDQITEGPQIVVGSSMGGWISLLLTLNRPERVKGLLTIACATDFTERLLRPVLTEQQLDELERKGVAELHSRYRETPYRIGKTLMDEGRKHILLGDKIAVQCPVRMIHGTADCDVPPLISEMTLEKITSRDARLTLIENGDHRLSSPAQLKQITKHLASLRCHE